MNDTSATPGGWTLAAFIGFVFLGGGNFLAVRFSNTELPPFWGAGFRFGLAAVVFVLIALALRLAWPKGKLLAHTALYGLFTFTFSYALMYWALTKVTAGMAAVILASVPLVTPLLAAVQRLERLQPRVILGAVLALAGILWMTVGVDGLVLPVSGLLAMLVAAFTIGQSVIYSKRISANHPVMNNAVGMGIGFPALLVISLIAGEAWALPTQPRAAWSVAYLVVGGSVTMFVLSLLVVRRWTASATAYAFVLFPVVTMVLEASLADVPLTVRGVSGAAVVMAGVWFGAFHQPAPSPPVPEAATAPNR